MMKISFTIFAIVAFQLCSFSQDWNRVAYSFNYGISYSQDLIWEEIKMLEEGVGYGVGHRYISPSSGTEFKVVLTKNDFEEKSFLHSEGAGGSGCCSVIDFDFLNDSTYALSKQHTQYYWVEKYNGDSSETIFLPSLLMVRKMEMISCDLIYAATHHVDSDNQSFSKIQNNDFVEVFSFDTLSFYSSQKVKIQMLFVDSLMGFASMIDTIGNHHLVKTENSGVDWEICFSSDTIMSSIDFSEDSVIYCSTISGDLYYSTNYGITWNVYDFNFGESIRSVDFLNSDKGVVGSDSGYVHRTSDAGVTWTTEVLEEDHNLIGSFYVNDSTIYMFSGNRGLFKYGWLFQDEEEMQIDSGEAFNIFPNPVQNKIHLNWMLNSDFDLIEIYNSSGQLIFSSKNEIILIDSWKDGMYHLIVHWEGKFESSTFLVVK